MNYARCFDAIVLTNRRAVDIEIEQASKRIDSSQVHLNLLFSAGVPDDRK